MAVDGGDNQDYCPSHCDKGGTLLKLKRDIYLKMYIYLWYKLNDVLEFPIKKKSPGACELSQITPYLLKKKNVL